MNEPHTLYYREIASPIGPLVLEADNGRLCGVEFGAAEANLPRMEAWADRWLGPHVWTPQPAGAPAVPEAAVLDAAAGQLAEYFRGERTRFEVPLVLHGTDFQKRVWLALCEVGYGRTASYKQIAEALGDAKAVRAVGGANNRNPIAIIVPCHRVIGANGALVGFGGGLDIKIKLLDLEAYGGSAAGGLF
ncbi:methylated-DNA--[protein]-cysteine S-methyltransferase [Paenibacillus athensensis]|uniref:Methylated-DNA--protein-cysteine methyltransferase n=1 Tax=Paenibacillus athensensis TaxID=1967502 RepID=A0A4Y8Q2R7_9BACL|nr:methylated-DNA--[protein]-cysteine S-methyltransferase [Paenibacillus athensensis]MCD1258737.1 methylated-DNA--[protein]-cysteine S-methyltransferase [Paenibacillus athensensis]